MGSSSCVQDRAGCKHHRRALLPLSDTLATMISRGQNPEGFVEDGACSQGSHLSVKEILQSCVTTLQREKKYNSKNLSLSGCYKTQNKTSGCPGNVQLGERGPQGNASGHANLSLSAAPRLKQPSHNFCFCCLFEQYVERMCSCLQIYAFTLCTKKSLPSAKKKNKWTELRFLTFSSHCSESAQEVVKDTAGKLLSVCFLFLFCSFLNPGLIQSKVNQEPRLDSSLGSYTKVPPHFFSFFVVVAFASGI